MYFGDVVDGRMELSEIGEWTWQCAEKMETINDNVFVPEFVVMPNHVHLIVIMDNVPEWSDDQRLPRCDSHTTPTGNDVPDGGFVGLPYYDSRLCESAVDLRLPQYDSPTTLMGNDVPDGGFVGLPYYDSRIENVPEINEEMQSRANRCGRLSHMIGQFKSAVTKYANQHEIPFAWQPRFHDHIIRNGVEMNRIADYIQNNPMNWELDRFYKKR